MVKLVRRKYSQFLNIERAIIGKINAIRTHIDCSSNNNNNDNNKTFQKVTYTQMVVSNT